MEVDVGQLWVASGSSNILLIINKTDARNVVFRSTTIKRKPFIGSKKGTELLKWINLDYFNYLGSLTPFVELVIENIDMDECYFPPPKVSAGQLWYNNSLRELILLVDDGYRLFNVILSSDCTGDDSYLLGSARGETLVGWCEDMLKYIGDIQDFVEVLVEKM